MKKTKLAEIESDRTLEDHLPAIIDPEALTLNIPDDLPANAPLSSSKQGDVQHANNMLRLMYAALGKASSVSSLCKISSEVMAIVERRRKLMCLQYGAESKSAGPKDYDPLD